MLEQIRSSVIVVAKSFNPSIVTPLWLAGKGLISQQDEMPGSFYADEVSQTVTTKYNLVVLPPQLQFSPKTPEVEWKMTAINVVGEILKSLPETPYVAMGINFAVDFVPADQAVSDFERDVFFHSCSPIASMFSADGCRYGGYFSRDFHDGRMKLDAKPVTAVVDGQKEDRTHLEFNFHRDVANGVSDLLQHLANWDHAWDFVRTTMGILKHE